MGEVGRAWVARDFDWNVIAGSMEGVYRWLSGSEQRPACVVVD